MHKPIYSLFSHEYLGVLIAPYLIQLDENGKLTFTYKKLTPTNAKDFKEYLSPSDFEIIDLLAQIDPTNIVPKLTKKKVRLNEFFLKHFQPEMKTQVQRITENKMAKSLKLMQPNQLFLMGVDGIPIWEQLEIKKTPASVLFHFIKNDQGTRYYPNIRHEETLVRFKKTGAQVITYEPFFLLAENKVYHFDDNLDGKKIKPFFDKHYISIPPQSEKIYYQKFIRQVIENHRVKPEGFKIISQKSIGKAILKLQKNFLDSWIISLVFNYNGNEILANDPKKVAAKLEIQNNKYSFIKTLRAAKWEFAMQAQLESLGLKNSSGANFELTKKNPENELELLDWISENRNFLEDKNFTIFQDENSKEYYLENSQLNLNIKEKNDWFDIKAKVRFGAFEIPFLALRDNILNQKKEYKLPNGKIAIIPEIWFSKLQAIFFFIEENENEIQLQKHHIALLQEMQREEKTKSQNLDIKIQNLKHFEKIENINPAKNFSAKLRPYQQAGLDWLWFLRQFNFGGCLADDMGLGKTVQTLALLQKDKETNLVKKNQNHKPSLLIVPTSLIFNWLHEAKHFTSDLKIWIHAGVNRKKNIAIFQDFDLIITSYGTARIDAELLKKTGYNYMILDEGQVIKNPTSKTARALKTFKSRKRLILSGTPIENSVMDLWSLMSFVNPGLLGNQKFFKEKYVIPIEKQKDETQAKKLQTLIKPFLLRRTKNQVAKDLPDKIDQTIFCKMSENQEKTYEKYKSSFRNEILEEIGKSGKNKSQMILLKGLTILRQIANHPKLVEENYPNDSGKFEAIVNKINIAISEGHKLLVFSQFVKHLKILQDYLNENNQNYFYLDGQTPNQKRQELVKNFNESENVKLFLISLKAGGLGLNLTSADYVLLLDPWWNPAVEQQAIDRTHRIGQTKTVISYRFISKNSVEEKIQQLQKHKQNLSDQLIKTESSFLKDLTLSDIKAILD